MRSRFELEPLEPRILLSVDPLGVDPDPHALLLPPLAVLQADVAGVPEAATDDPGGSGTGVVAPILPPSMNGVSVTTTGDPEWKEQGPAPITGGFTTEVGAVEAISVDPADPNHVALGTVGGGVWITQNLRNVGGPQWETTTDQLPSLAIGSIAWSPLNLDASGNVTSAVVPNSGVKAQTLYAGTGSFSNGDDQVGASVGVYRSTDGGQTWSVVGTKDLTGLKIRTIVPTTLTENGKQVLLAATSGDLRTAGSSQEGLWRSTDSGETWTRIGDNKIFTGTIATVNGATVTFTENPGWQVDQFAGQTVSVVPTDTSILAGANDKLTSNTANSLTYPSAADLTGLTAGTQVVVSLNAWVQSAQASALVADPIAAGGDAFYAAFPQFGIVKSVPGTKGAQWVPLSVLTDNTLLDSQRIELAVSQAPGGSPGSGVIYAATLSYQSHITAWNAATRTLTVERAEVFQAGDTIKVQLTDPGGALKYQDATVTATNWAAHTVTVDTDPKTAGNQWGNAAAPDTSGNGTAEMPSLNDLRPSALLRSDDGGATWTALNVPSSIETVTVNGVMSNTIIGSNPGSQGMTNFSLLVDPTNADNLYAAGDTQMVDNYLGTDDYVSRSFFGVVSGGTVQWHPVVGDGNLSPGDALDGANGTAAHADSRDMAWSMGELLEADDGGVYLLASPSTAARFWSSMNYNLGLDELYSVAYDPVNHVILGGAQDQGALRQRTVHGQTWLEFLGGDGTIVAVAPLAAIAPDVTTTPAQVLEYFALDSLGLFSRIIANGIDDSMPLDFDVDDSSEATWLSLKNLPIGKKTLDEAFAFRTPFALNAANPARILIADKAGHLIDLRQGTAVGNVVNFTSTWKRPDPPSGKKHAAVVTALLSGGWERVGGVLKGRENVAYVAFVRQEALRARRHRRLQARQDEGLQGDGDRRPRDRPLQLEDGVRARQQRPRLALERRRGLLDRHLRQRRSLSRDLRTIEYVNPTEAAGDEGLLVGGQGGVFRLLDPANATSASAQWSEFGRSNAQHHGQRPHWDRFDNVLVAGTAGRGAWEISQIDTEIATRSTLTITGTSGDDTIRLVRAASNPSLLEVHVAGVGGAPEKVGQIQLSTLQEIHVAASAGNDTVILDQSNGVIGVPGDELRELARRHHRHGGGGQRRRQRHPGAPGLEVLPQVGPDRVGDQRQGLPGRQRRRPDPQLHRRPSRRPERQPARGGPAQLRGRRRRASAWAGSCRTSRSPASANPWCAGWAASTRPCRARPPRAASAGARGTRTRPGAS